MMSKNFEAILSKLEKAAWIDVKNIVAHFSGNNQSLSYKKLINSYKNLGCLILLKIHF